jgi:hypothetical protein
MVCRRSGPRTFSQIAHILHLSLPPDSTMECEAAEVRGSLLVDPQELRKSESVRNETAKAAIAISARMSAYMYSVPTPITTMTLQA